MIITEQSSTYIVKYYYPGNKFIDPQWVYLPEFNNLDDVQNKLLELKYLGFKEVSIEKKTSFSSESCKCLDDGIC